MIAIEQAKKLSHVIVNHVCDYLSIDGVSIRIIFTPRV